VTAYPESAADRTRWITEKRGPRNAVTPERPHAFFVEGERTDSGDIAKVATIFLTNRECPWKCLMCDLWRNTTPAPTGSIPKQIRHAFNASPELRKATVLKLYNSGSFFDLAAIPKSDWPEIAALCRPFSHVILECHPHLVGTAVLEFAAMLNGTLEIAMGLETVHPVALERLNKRITLKDFEHAALFLRSNSIALRTFLLVGVPYISSEEQMPWLQKSMNGAFDAGANVVSLIPTRTGNGALDALETLGEFHQPTLADLEAAHDYGINLQRGRVFADTWDLDRFAPCDVCLARRRARLHRTNLSQRLERRIDCRCGD
jgi:radical SAM enzyme (TIGR01210 family)